MAGDYKSYLIRASTPLVFCIIGVQHLWCLTLQTQLSQADNVSCDTLCSDSTDLCPIPPWNHTANARNWSCEDRMHTQNTQQKQSLSFDAKHCQSFAEQPFATKTYKNGLQKRTSRNDDCDGEIHYIARGCNADDASQLPLYAFTDTTFEPWFPMPLLWMMVIFEFFDVVLTLQAQDEQAYARCRRDASRLLPLRLIKLLGIFLCIGLVAQRMDCVLPVEHQSDMHLPCKNYKATCKQKKHKKIPRSMPDPFSTMFGTTTCVWFPERHMRALSLHVVGDGNCMWRALAKSQNKKWYTLKRKVIHYIASQKDPEHDVLLKQISERNAWGNFFALTAVAAFLRKDIRVFTTQVVIDISIAGSRGSVSLALENFHYSLMQNKSADYLIKHNKSQFPQTMQHYLQRQNNAPHYLAHRRIYAQKNGGTQNYKYTKIEPARAKTLQKHLASMVASSKLPAYKPAGTPSGRRRPCETFSEQINRVSKARASGISSEVAQGGHSMAPKTPPKAPASGLIPKPPAGPPPAHLRSPPDPKCPPAKVIIRPAVPRSPPIAKGQAAPAATPPVQKARPKTPAMKARPSCAPNILNAGAGRSSSSGSTEPPVAYAAEPHEPPCIKLQELLIVSRGTRAECVQVTRRPSELEDPDRDIILKSLHKIDNPQRDRTLQGHIGTNPRMILQLVQYKPMQTAVLNVADRALRSQKAAVIFECSQGRHRSVGAAGILYLLLQPLVPRIKIIHASNRNWSSTCGGQCPECKKAPFPAFHHEIELLRQALLSELQSEYIELFAIASIHYKHLYMHNSSVRQADELGHPAIQHLLGCLLLFFTLDATHDVRDCFDDGIILRATDNCMNSTQAFGSRNCDMQKSQHGKNFFGNYHNKMQAPSRLVQPKSQCVSFSLRECPEQPRRCRELGPGDYPYGRQIRRRFVQHSAFGSPKFGCLSAFSRLWWILSGGMFHRQMSFKAFPILDYAPIFRNNFGSFQLKMSIQSQHLQKLAHTSKNQVQNKQEKTSSTILDCFKSSLQCLQSVMRTTRATSQIKRLDQPRNLCYIGCGGWSGDEASGAGRLLHCCLLQSSILNVPKIRRSLIFLLVLWIFISSEIVLQFSSDCHMCGHDIDNLHAQSSCLLQDCTVVQMTTVPTQFALIGYPHLIMHNTCLHGNMCPSCNVEKLQYTKIQHPAKIVCSNSFTMVAASKLPAYRPAGQQSGQRRPNESFEQQIQRITKAKMASRMMDRGQEMETSVPKTPPKSRGSVAPTTPPKAAGAKMPVPPPGPPPGNVPAPKAKVFLRPAVPRPPPAKRIAAPCPPPVAPKDATPQGGYGSTIPKAHVRPKPPTPPARPSRAPHVIDAIPAMPEAATAGSTSSGSTELPKAAADEPPRQFRLQELLIISRGTRPECVQLTRRPPELQDPTWDVILKSLHQLDNPQRDRTLQGHIGINRRMIMQLVQYAPMRTAVLKAASQALRSERAIVIFECSQGRHRSVGAAGMLYQVLEPLIPKLKLIHASSKNWKGTCGGDCPECRSGPPPAFHDEIAVLRNELLAQTLSDYMEPPALAFGGNNLTKSHSNCPACQVGEIGCQAFQHLFVGLQVCYPFCNKNTPFHDSKIIKSFAFKVSNKNQLQQKSAQASKNHFQNTQHAIGTQVLRHFIQILQYLYFVAQSLVAYLHYESSWQSRNKFLNAAGRPMHGQMKMCLAVCGGWFSGIFQGCHVLESSVFGGMESSHLLDEHLYQQILPLPQTCPQPVFEDFLLFQNMQEDNFDSSVQSLQSASGSMNQPHIIEEPCSSPSSSPSWIGAQPDPEADYERDVNNQPGQDPIAGHRSCATTEIDDQSSHSSATLPFYAPSPSFESKKRKFSQNIVYAQQQLTDEQQREQKEIDVELMYENWSHSCCSSHTQSRAVSIQQFLEHHGPYPGWEYDEYPQSIDLSPTQSICSDDTGSARGSSSRELDSRPDVLNFVRNDTLSQESFWDNWILDSDGNFRPRPIGSPDASLSFASYHTDPFDQVPTQDMINIFEGASHQIDPEPNTPSSHASLQPLVQALYRAAGFDDADGHVIDSAQNHQLQNQQHSFSGGANDGFQPAKADISKLVQKLKCVDHQFAPKQIRMLLISDPKFMKKIERTSDAKQLLSCVQAAATRMGLQTANAPKQKEFSNASNGFNITNAPLPFSNDANKGKGKDSMNRLDKGKGKGKQPNTSKPSPEHDKRTDSAPPKKGKSKGKGQDAKNNTFTISKAKGKGQGQTVTYKLDPEGWNVLPLDTFVPSHGAIYVCEKVEQAKRIAEQGVGKNFPIGVLSPFPMDIGVKAPEVIFAEFTKSVGDKSHKISMQAYLHQITYADAVYRKAAPSVSIQRPAIAQTSVCYLTISDEGACAQTTLELQQKRLPAFKQWISTLLQHNRKLDILDVWNPQQINKNEQVTTYQVSARIASAQLESLLAMSGPGKLQVNVPGPLRLNIQHIWLKKEGRPMTPDEVCAVLTDTRGKHLGAFCVRGTWAIRMLNEHHNELKVLLGRDEDPAFFISNLPPDMEADSVRELLSQLHWQASVKEGERRWRGAGYTWLVRSKFDPRVWEFPINYGYERRMVRIQAARKPKINPPTAVPDNTPLHFSSWNAQCRTGRHQPKPSDAKPAYVDMFSAARKRPKLQSHLDVKIPDEGESFKSDEEMELNETQQAENMKLQEQIHTMKQRNADQQSETAKLHEQMQAMTKQNAEQQQLIHTLTKQIAELTQQLQLLTAQSLNAGASTAQEQPIQQAQS